MSNVDDYLTPREPKAPKPKHTGQTVGLPPRFFLYTLDQIATMLNVKIETLSASYVYFEGRSTYAKKKGQLAARNIAPPDQPATWRVLDTELVRWMRFKGYRYYETGRFGESRQYDD